MSEVKHKIGIMGGTFDPIHVGHLMIAECAYDQFNLEYVLFMPSGKPPHKTTRKDGADVEARLAMTKLAIADNPHFIIDEEEVLRSGYTYTNETLRILHQQHPENEYYFIIGADSLMAFDSWKNPEIICQNCTLLAAVRDHLERSAMEQQVAYLKEKYNARIFLLDSPNIDLSSTALRNWIKEHKSVKYYIPDNVVAYIMDHQIYQEV